MWYGGTLTSAASVPSADAWLAETRADRGEVSETPAGDENPVADVIYTSGTSSEPKGVLLRHETLVSYVLGSVEFASADDTEAALDSVPRTTSPPSPM